MMHIEKVTKYVNTASPSRSSSGTVTVRTVPMSLPRVRWLERDPDYKAEGVVNPTSEPTVVAGAVIGKSVQYKTRNLVKGMPLTEREKSAYDLDTVQKLSQRKACVQMGIAHSTYRQHLIKAKIKLGVDL